MVIGGDRGAAPEQKCHTEGSYEKTALTAQPPDKIGLYQVAKNLFPTICETDYSFTVSLYSQEDVSEVAYCKSTKNR